MQSGNKKCKACVTSKEMHSMPVKGQAFHSKWMHSLDIGKACAASKGIHSPVKDKGKGHTLDLWPTVLLQLIMILLMKPWIYYVLKT